MYLAFRFGYLWVLLHTNRLASKNMFLIMSYAHNKVVSALNGNEAYRVTPTGGVLWKPGVLCREEWQVWPPSCCSSHRPSTAAALKGRQETRMEHQSLAGTWICWRAAVLYGIVWAAQMSVHIPTIPAVPATLCFPHQCQGFLLLIGTAPHFRGLFIFKHLT